MLKKLAVVAIMLATLAGCAIPNRQDVLNKWLGRSIQEATMELGPPHRTVPMPMGGMMYVWEQQYGRQMETLCRTGLQVDYTGIIIDASQQSNSLLCR